MGKEYVAKLNNWSVQFVDGDEVLLWGEVEGDKRGRWADGTVMHTSGIKIREFKEGDIVTTRNSKYLLGAELVVPANLSEESEVCSGSS